MIAAWLAAVLLLSDPDESRRTPRVELVLDPCLTIEPAEFEPQVALEFEHAVVVSVSRERGEPGSSTTLLTITCSEAGLQLSLEDPLTAKTMQRELAIGPSEPALARTLALAVVEFVRASWLELELDDERRAREPEPPIVPLRDEAPAPAQVEQARALARRPRGGALTLSLGPRLAVLAEQGLVHGGGQLRLVHRPRRVLAWTLAGSLVHGQHPLAIGRLDATSFALAPALLATMVRGEFGLLAGVGGQLGGVRVVGRPEPGAGLASERFTRAHAGVFALGRASFELPASLVLAVELELGVVTLPVRARAGEAIVYAFAGPWVAGGLELGFGWPRRRPL